jgi:hypothetical protein
MLEKLPLWEAAKREMEVYQFAVEAEIQPKWNVPHKIAINAAISSRFGDSKQSKPMSIENYVDAASSVIEAGAWGFTSISAGSRTIKADGLIATFHRWKHIPPFLSRCEFVSATILSRT